MREIRFRGWDIVGHKWVYGDLVHNKKPLVEEPFLADRVMVGGYEVDPETVGQYTGLRDEQGMKIYEGDILFTIGTREDNMGHRFFREVCYVNGTFSLYNSELNSCTPLNESFLGMWRVAGNIYDNADLVKQLIKDDK